jgi:hypothetical protein
MQTVSLPVIRYPYPDLINQHLTLAEFKITEWIKDYRSIPEMARIKYAGSLYGELAARLYPNADKQTLLAASRHILLFFILDDLCGQLNTHELQLISQQAINILNGEDEPLQNNDFFHQFALLRDELLAQASAQWMQRYIYDIRDYFKTLPEAGFYSANDVYPTLRQYLQIREKTSGMYKWLDLAELAAAFVMPQSVFLHPYTVRLRYLTARILGSCRDYYSFFRETVQGPMNMVSVIRYEQACATEEALEKMVRLHNEDLADFDRLIHKVPDFGVFSKGFDRYIYNLELMIQGHTLWYGATNRYQN